MDPAVRNSRITPTHALCFMMSSQVGPSSFRGSRANPSIHNVIRRPGRNLTGNLVSLRSLSRFWWSQTGSNRRPHACKARALPTELWPLLKPASLGTRRLARRPRITRQSVVGPGRLELPTSRLSGVCSNQLSYRPLKRHIQAVATYSGPRYAIAPQPHRLQCHAERETKTATLCYLHSVCERTNRA